jgi:hypothetical protein
VSNPDLFSNVLTKFFTGGKEYENKGATDTDRPKGKDRPMIEQIKDAVTRSRDTLLSDAIGAMALMVILVVGLHLPNFS